MKCAICSQELPENTKECPFCFDSLNNGKDAEEVGFQIYALLKKAKVWILVGLAVLPGWICHPLAFKFSSNALKLYRSNNIEDENLELRIQRIRIISGILSLIYWIFTLVYLLK